MNFFSAANVSIVGRSKQLSEVAMAQFAVTPNHRVDAERVSVSVSLHPAWVSFIRYCEDLGHGEIEKLKIQDGLPVMAEMTTKKVKFL